MASASNYKALFALVALVVAAASCGAAESVVEAMDQPLSDSEVPSLEVGQCFDNPSVLTAVEELTAVDCAGPHDNEVYFVFDIVDGDYPGLETVVNDSQKRCIGEFDAFVNFPYMQSEFDVYTLYPTEQTWTVVDDREVICALYRVDEQPWTGTARDAKR